MSAGCLQPTVCILTEEMCSSVSADFNYRQYQHQRLLNVDLAAWVTEEFATDLSKGAKFYC